MGGHKMVVACSLWLTGRKFIFKITIIDTWQLKFYLDTQFNKFSKKKSI